MDKFKENVTTIYAISENTTISFPDGICNDGIIWVEIAEENGSFRVVDETAGGPIETSFGIDDTWSMTFIMLPCYLVSGIKDQNPSSTSDNEDEVGVGATGSSVGMFKDGSFVDYLAFYVPANEKAGDPFASLSPATPNKPVTPATPSTPDTPTAPGKPAFTDVAANAYYAEPVKWAVEKNITSGTSKTLFSPNQTCTTAQIIAFLWRSKGSPEPVSKSNPFTDVKESDYYYKAALWAKENNILPQPFNPAFNGSAPCTRGMAVLYIWKADGAYAAENHSNFTDVADTTLYAPAVDWAVQNGVTSGTSATTFSPESTCTRGQIVTFLYRAFGK